MGSLYDLTVAYIDVQNAIDDGKDDWQSVLDTLDEEIESKADNCAKLIANMKAQVDAIKAETERLNARKKQLETAIDAIKNNLETAMKQTGKTKFKTNLFTFAIQKNGGKAPVILDVKDTSELPDELVRIKEEPDMDAIRKLLDEGDCTYAHYGERGENLRIK